MLKHDPNIRESKTWEDFQEKGLCPEIDNLEKYRAKFEKTNKVAEENLPKWQQPILDPEKVKELHGTLFEGIYPWAGTFRHHELPCRSRDGAIPENIGMELEMLQTQTKILLDETSSTTALFRIAAFHHARLTNIQAFGDGNTRTSRLVTETFLTVYTGRNRITEMTKPEYLDALEQALGQENLTPLANIFRSIYGETPEKGKWCPSPFQTTNQIEVMEGHKALKKTFRQQPELLDEEIPTKANFLVRWPWSKTVSILEGNPTKTFGEAEELWEEAREKTQTLREIDQLLKELEALKPLKRPPFGLKPYWGSLRKKIKPHALEWPQQDSGIHPEP